MTSNNIYYRVGDTDPVVATTKAQLGRLGYPVGDPTSGLFDHQFELSVKAFQQDRGLVTDGTLGPETFFQIEFARHRLGDRVLSYDPVRQRQGDDVAELQKQLSRLGIYADRIDFTFGPLTHTAVRDFQSDSGLNADGIAGPSTIQALKDVQREGTPGNLYALRERARVMASGQSLAGRVIVVESGCSARDFPTAGHSAEQQRLESEFSDDIARRIEGRLIALGAAAVRAGIEQPKLGDELGAAAVISVSQDVDSSSRANGIATFYYGEGPNSSVVSPVGRSLGNLVQRELSARTPFLSCGAHARTWESLRMVRTPKVHVLAGYLTNRGDRRLLSDSSVRDAIAESVVVGVQRLFLGRDNDQDTGTINLAALNDLLQGGSN